MYVPPGIDPGVVEKHILDLEGNVLLSFPESQATLRQIVLADSPAPVNF
jgi:hypothetical protein